MAANSWMLRQSNARSARLNRSRVAYKEDHVSCDVNEDPRQNVTRILSSICQISDLSEGKRLNYLNAFVKVTLHIEGNFEGIGFTIKDILTCLRVALLHESTQVRSGALRAIRHVLRNDEDIIQLSKLLIPFLIARSLDLVLRHDVERVEAMKLIRKILLLSPNHFHVSLGRSLVALANADAEEKDRMLRISLATLCELGVMNTDVFVEIGGVSAITRNLLECQTPKIAESLCGVLLLLLDRPSTRNQACIDLHSVAAPYCDFHFRLSWKDKDKYMDERELRFNCSRLALLSILRSWPGLMHFCSPNNKAGLKAIVDVLYLKQLEVRKAVLDLLYELLGLPQPEWTDELSVALSAVDPCEPQSSWRLNEGFVAAEGRSILPHLAKTTPSMTDMHLALLLYCFLECGLLKALVEVIATSDTFISVRATVLLGELLHLIQVLLPPECCDISPPLPNLLDYATHGKPQAAKAVNGLQQLEKLLRARPASYSLHLDYIMRNEGSMKMSTRSGRKSKHKGRKWKSQLNVFFNKDGDDVIKETGVLLNKDAYTWNWNLIRLILKGEAMMLELSDTSHRNFLKRLVDFYTPSHNRYSHMDLSSNKISLAYTTTGIDLINCLVELEDDYSAKLLLELFTDISSQISAITSGKSVHDCLFSPQHMNSTQCQSYFLFVGRLATNELGTGFLMKLDMFKKLEHLAITTNNDCYVKLIVSSLDYSTAGPCRNLLEAVLSCPVESSRLYATQFLLVLLRAGTAHFYQWGVKYLVNQLKDSSRSIYLSALATLHEACEIPDCLETIVALKPDLTHLGEKGALLSVRLLSSVSGFKTLNQNDYIVTTIQQWDSHLNYRYIKLVEGETSDVLTLHQRDEAGKYDKRTSAIRTTSRKDTFLPPHLYGQLSVHPDGAALLSQHGSLEEMLRVVDQHRCNTDAEIMQLKAALWALGHFASTTVGVLSLVSHDCLSNIVDLARECLVFSIRATAYYVLGLIATTRQGASELFRLGWLCTRHNRHINWPIIEEEVWVEDLDDTIRSQDQFSEMCLFDSGIKDVEGSTDDDCSESIMTESAVANHQKSLTLPAGQNLSSACHQRSLSESKTFDFIRTDESRLRPNNPYQLDVAARRIRNISMTESTTSGVSSCESMGGGKSIIYERQPILSPIPSSCSLSTLKQPGKKLRRHSESSRRISVQSGSNSDKSSQSLMVGSMPNRLSHQDLMGYTTLRHIRKPPRFYEEPKTLWKRPFLDDFFRPETEPTKCSSISESHTDDRCYMGISLPIHICDLFLQSDKNLQKYNDKFPIAEEAMRSIDENKIKEEELVRRHNVEACLNCSWNPNQREEVFIRVNENVSLDDFPSLDQSGSDSIMRSRVLRLVDQLSNPVWSKQVKQTLLLCKQQCPQVFQDPCLYSEVSKAMSESTYRLSSRRMLHELFLEVNYDVLYEEASRLFQFVEETVEDGSPKLDNEVAQSSNMKKLNSMKLTFKENKFPIRTQNESKIV